MGEPRDLVLLVDDDPDVTTLLSAALRATGLDTETAHSGNEALEKLGRRRPTVIVCDVVMPGMSGYELCSLARALGFDDVPFLFCTALGGLPERIAGLKMGADDWIVKPAEPEEVVLKVLAQLRRVSQLRSLKEGAHGGGSPRLMQGRLGELVVADLLQIVDLFGLEHVWIRLDRAGGGRGAIYVGGEKAVVHAVAGEIRGPKAFFRILEWRDATFLIEHGRYDGEPSMSGRLDQRLLEGLAYLDEYRQLKATLGADGQSFEIQYGPDLLSHGFDDKTTRLLGLIETHHDLPLVLDRSPLTDLKTLQIIGDLLEAGVIGSRPGGELATTEPPRAAERP